MLSYSVLFMALLAFQVFIFFQNSVLSLNFLSFHTLSLGHPIYTCSLICKLNTDDFAQWFTLDAKQTFPINVSTLNLNFLPSPNWLYLHSHYKWHHLNLTTQNQKAKTQLDTSMLFSPTSNHSPNWKLIHLLNSFLLHQ